MTIAPTVTSSSLGCWLKSIASAGQAATHDLHSEQTAQSRQRSASATASSSLKPRRTSSQVVRRSTPSQRRHDAPRLRLERRQLGRAGSWPCRASLVPDAARAARRAGSCASRGRRGGRPRWPRWPSRGPSRPRRRPRTRPGARSSSCRGRRRSGPSRGSRRRRPPGSRRPGPGRRRRSPCRPRARRTRPRRARGGASPRSLGSPSVQRWNLTPVALPSLPRISTGMSEYSTCTCSSLALLDPPPGWREPCARPRCRRASTCSAPQRKAVRPAS